MNIFSKSKLKGLLDNKVINGEIKSYQLNPNNIHIKKSKRCKYTLEISGLSDDILIRLFTKKIPNADQINVSDFFKVELRNLKLNKIL